MRIYLWFADKTTRAFLRQKHTTLAKHFNGISRLLDLRRTKQRLELNVAVQDSVNFVGFSQSGRFNGTVDDDCFATMSQNCRPLEFERCYDGLLAPEHEDGCIKIWKVNPPLNPAEVIGSPVWFNQIAPLKEQVLNFRHDIQLIRGAMAGLRSGKLRSLFLALISLRRSGPSKLRAAGG